MPPPPLSIGLGLGMSDTGASGGGGGGVPGDTILEENGDPLLTEASDFLEEE